MSTLAAGWAAVVVVFDMVFYTPFVCFAASAAFSAAWSFAGAAFCAFEADWSAGAAESAAADSSTFADSVAALVDWAEAAALALAYAAVSFLVAAAAINTTSSLEQHGDIKNWL